MFGKTMAFEVGDFSIRMRPFKNADEYKESSMGWNSQKVMRYFDLGPFGSTDQNIEDAFNRIREGDSSVFWAIEHIDDDKIIGYTQFFNWNKVARTAESSVLIWNTNYWNQKITSHVHQARTYYGAKILNLAAMKSYVLTKNEASIKSLEKVGYKKFGVLKSYYFVEGEYLDGDHMVWYNPAEKEALFPDGAPKEIEKQFSTAEKSLEKAKDHVIFP